MGALRSGCERAREWASLELDGELSEFEHALLRAHLDGCAPCASYAHDVRAVARELRAAPAELPSGVVTLPARRRGGVGARVLQAGAAAAAVAVAVGLGSIAGSLTSSGPAGRLPHAAAVAATQQPYLEQRLLALDRNRQSPAGGEAIPV